MLICPASTLKKNFKPWNTTCMPVVKIFFRLESEQIIYFVIPVKDGTVKDGTVKDGKK